MNSREFTYQNLFQIRILSLKTKRIMDKAVRQKMENLNNEKEKSKILIVKGKIFGDLKN